jgi:hypothetical protein
MMVPVFLAVCLFVFAMLLDSGENQRHNERRCFRVQNRWPLEVKMRVRIEPFPRK